MPSLQDIALVFCVFFFPFIVAGAWFAFWVAVIPNYWMSITAFPLWVGTTLFFMLEVFEEG